MTSAAASKTAQKTQKTAFRQENSAGIIVYKLAKLGKLGNLSNLSNKPDNKQDKQQDSSTFLFLLLLNSKGHWDFAKGHIKKGETEEQAAVRELKEEAGIEAELKEGFREKITYWFYDRLLYDRKDDVTNDENDIKKNRKTKEQNTKEQKAKMQKTNVQTKVQKTVVFFLGKSKTESVRVSYEHEDYKWASYHNALKTLKFDNQKKLLHAASEFLKHHS